MTGETLPWRDWPLAARLRVLRALRLLMADQASALARSAVRPGAAEPDILAAEVMPLLAACRFLERRAPRLLATRREGRQGRPLWLFGTTLLVRRVPLGRVLIIGPANYPLMLPGVQALQSLAAGNTVLLKPAPGFAPPLVHLAALLHEAGLPPGTLTVLDDTEAAAQAAIADGVDHVVLTGSAPSGRAVLAGLAPRLIPATMELSGRDPFIVLQGADLGYAAQALLFGLTFNAGRTCIAPRRVIVERAVSREFRAAIGPLLEGAPAIPPVSDAAAAAAILREAGGAVIGGPNRLPALVVTDEAAPWPHEDIFAPLAAFTVVADEAAAIRLANAGPYALGAAVFGPPARARRVAASLRAGCVVVGDVIAPTADPRLPFGGTGASGFGVTRGAEGLLAMTRPQAIVIRRRPERRHLRPLADADAPILASFLRLIYGRRPVAALWTLSRTLARRRRPA